VLRLRLPPLLPLLLPSLVLPWRGAVGLLATVVLLLLVTLLARRTSSLFCCTRRRSSRAM
jgi:hypothetical protein